MHGTQLVHSSTVMLQYKADSIMMLSKQKEKNKQKKRHAKLIKLVWTYSSLYRADMFDIQYVYYPLDSNEVVLKNQIQIFLLVETSNPLAFMSRR